MVSPLALSPITAFLRDMVVTTITVMNQRMRWIICGSGRSGVSTLQSAFQTPSDIMPDLPTTQAKVGARVINARAGPKQEHCRTAFFFSRGRRHTKFLPVSWARRCVLESARNGLLRENSLQAYALSLIHTWRCRRIERYRARGLPTH